jgi:hypothetical protein
MKRKRGRPRKDNTGFFAPNTPGNFDVITQAPNSVWVEIKSTEAPCNEDVNVQFDDWELEIDGVTQETPNSSFDNESGADEQASISEAPTLHEATPPLVVSKQHTTIHLVDGEKGGAGKSFVSKALIEYCSSINHSVMVVDADNSNQDISRIYRGVKSAYFSDDEKLATEADAIFDLAFQKSVIINLPAQVYSKVTTWINDNDLIELGKEHSISFVKWFVCTGGADSVNFFIQSLQDLGDKVTHVLVRNKGLWDNWDELETMPEYIAAKSEHNFYVIDFPKFPYWERNKIDRLSITFSDALAHPGIKVISKQRIKCFLKKAYAEFSQTGLIK